MDILETRQFAHPSRYDREGLTSKHKRKIETDYGNLHGWTHSPKHVERYYHDDTGIGEKSTHVGQVIKLDHHDSDYKKNHTEYKSEVRDKSWDFKAVHVGIHRTADEARHELAFKMAQKGDKGVSHYWKKWKEEGGSPSEKKMHARWDKKDAKKNIKEAKTYKQFMVEVIQNSIKTASEIKGSEVGDHISKHPWLKNKIGSFRGSHVYHDKHRNTHDFYAVDKKSGIIHKQLSTTTNKGGTHTISSLAGIKHDDQTHHFYHHLITKHNVVIAAGLKHKNQSHGTQSRGAIKVWQKLHGMRGVQVHAYHKGKASHVDEIGLGTTHVHWNERRDKRTHAANERRKVRDTVLVAHKEKK